MKSLVTLVLVLAGIGLIFLVAKPQWAEIIALRTQNETIAGALRELHDLQGFRDELLSAHNSISKNNLDRLTEMLPQKSDSGQLLVALEKLTRDHGIRLRKVEFESTEKAQLAPAQQGVIQKDQSRVNTLSYAFTFSASYESFKSFLAALENNLRIIDVTDISFLGGETNLFEFNLRARSYYQKEGTSKGTVDRLKTIKIDTSFFSDPEFLDLASPPATSLESIDKGRQNPFLRR